MEHQIPAEKLPFALRNVHASQLRFAVCWGTLLVFELEVCPEHCSARKPRARESERSESGNLIPREERKEEQQAQGVGQNTDRVTERVASHSNRNRKRENSPSARPLDAERLTGSAGSSKGVEQEQEEVESEREESRTGESNKKCHRGSLPRTEVFLGFLYRGQHL